MWVTHECTHAQPYTLLKKYGLQDANPVSIPMDLNIKLDALEGEASEDSKDQLYINKPWLCKFDWISHVPCYCHMTRYSIFGQ